MLHVVNTDLKLAMLVGIEASATGGKSNAAYVKPRMS